MSGRRAHARAEAGSTRAEAGATLVVEGLARREVGARTTLVEEEDTLTP